MNDDAMHVLDLAMQGYQCSQILMKMALEAQGKQNEELVRAMAGLAVGMGAGKACGALTGGCSVLGLYAGCGSTAEPPDDRLPEMLSEFVDWFESEFTPHYGGIECATIVQDDMRNKMSRCPCIVMETLTRLKQILAEHGYAFEKSNRA